MSDEKTPAETPALRTPAHGKGKLRRGGPNGGAGGRPPDVIRAALRDAFWKHRKQLEEFAQSDDPSTAIKAMELMAKYGMGTTFTPTDDKGKTLNSINVTHQIVDAS